MKIHATITFIIFSIFQTIAQVNFEQGYYLTNNGVKTQGFIKNLGWKNNPESFTFKQNENSDEMIVQMEKIIEFGIKDAVKYVK